MSKTISDAVHLREEQYRTPKNFMARVALYERFGSGGPSLQDIRLDEMAIRSDESVIDFGCGNGLVWQTAKARNELPSDLTLVDLSRGMLDDAQKALGENRVTTIRHDLNTALASNRQYDIACAFHMLYHMVKPFAVMDEILSHVKSDGRAFVHLNAAGRRA